MIDPTPLISICLYTYNRAALLESALQSVCSQASERRDCEVVVADNRSNDNTRQVVDQFMQRFPNVRYAVEDIPGSSAARNRAWREACGDYVAFLDDDARAAPNWLAVAADLIETLAPDVFGGPYLAFYNSPKPDWFKDQYGSFEPHPQALRLAAYDGYLSGSNLFFRRSLLEKLGGFDTSLGMCGKQIGYGEETLLLRRVRQEFPDAVIYYEPRLIVHHLVRPEKFSLRWQVRNRFNLGRYNYLAFCDGVHTLKLRHVLGFLGLPVLIAGEATLGALLRSRRVYPSVRNYYFERVLKHLTTWGKLYERVLQNIRKVFRNKAIGNQGAVK